MSTADVIAALAAHPLFEGLAEGELARIAACGRPVRFDAGSTLLREGAAANAFYLLDGGSVALEVRAPRRGPLTIQTLHEGDVLGWSWLFAPYRWAFDARAEEPVTATEFDAACVRDACRLDPAFGYELVLRFASVITERLQATRLQLLDLYGTPA